MEVCCPYFDPEFDNLNEKIYGPRVYVDNESCERCTVVKVNSLNKQGLLLEVLEVLADVDLFINKSYISSDAGWFMDVFHVKDQRGSKIYDRKIIGYIKEAIGARRDRKNSEVRISKGIATKSETASECTVIEMIGPNRPGLFSEISAVLAEQRCNVVEAHAWSHNDCLACVAYISDESTSTVINDPDRLATIEDHLSTVLRPATAYCDRDKGVRAHFLGCDSSMSHTERRLHQLMLANRDFDGPPRPTTASTFSSMEINGDGEGRRTVVSIDRCNEKRYSVVNVDCVDRPKLMFDTVCTLTDMQYIVFHASSTSHGPFASQEYYIRHKDGRMLDSAGEKQLVVKCLEAAIERRICEGVRIELCTENTAGLLSYITRVLRENGLTVAHADIATRGEKTRSVLYVRDISGNKVDMGIIESIKRELEPFAFQVRNEQALPHKYSSEGGDGYGFSFVSLLRSQLERFSHSFVSI
ncbi:ACT domain-containing protein ACR2-like [Ananas comosus]|uniref:ACT domain-containing protein ACR n=1 Tax=Ananas comosus TaxID=4615 RepID=A0A6P5G251_ANACO|nr:ACT domain-containing protein ACR2-like [Ananas comosus]XP_020102448.1 ACT domain-containing protein ACR2-like [Ananas comosus]XP_020102449.1 ACT domain-containing protein ACR2-like [Ananas comosus]